MTRCEYPLPTLSKHPQRPLVREWVTATLTPRGGSYGLSTKPFIVLSGLPASGKTTLATKLANALRLPLFDKDDILEALFESAGPVDLAKRHQLSRMGDDVLARIASASQGAVLVSHWRHEGADGGSGTPVAWLSALSANMVEVHCVCPPEVAERRFKARQRHPAHNDAERAPSLASQFHQLARRGPLRIGWVISVATDEPYDLPALLEQVRDRLD